MADNEKLDADVDERFPAPPSSSHVPLPPRVSVTLPKQASVGQPGSSSPGRYRKLAVAATAATSFVAPIILLGVGGWWLDQRLHTTIGLCAFIGTVVGFIVGIVSLLGTIRQLNR